MVPFEILVELNNSLLSLQVEQLDYIADENGCLRYDVRTGLRQAVILVNIEDKPSQSDFRFEAIQAVGDDFSGEELLNIIQAIHDHNTQTNSPINQLPLFKN